MRIVLTTDDLLTLQDAARLLGITRPLLYHWDKIGKVHILKISSRSFLPKHEIEALVKAQANQE